MKLNLVFEEQDKNFGVLFGEHSVVSDGGYEKGYNDGFSLGETQGYNNGYSQGESEGYAKGETDGFSKGYDKGEADGYSKGETDGYNNGYGTALTKLDEIEITENGEYLPNEDKIGFSKVNVNVKSTAVEEKIVDFIDYDGTLLYSYSIEEAKALTEMPPLPEQDGLICQEWNWSFEDLQGYIADMEANDLPIYKITIGATYITDDGKTRVYLSLKDGRLSPILGFATDGTVVVDWGDGSELLTVTGTSTSTVIENQHTYPKEGDYVISLEVQSGTMYIVSSNMSRSTFIQSGHGIYGTSLSYVYYNTVTKIEFGEHCDVRGYYTFAEYTSLTKITIPNYMTSLDEYAFYCCYSLQCVIIPNGSSKMPSQMFAYCRSLVYISIPNSVLSFGQQVLYCCYALRNITIPNGVPSLPYYALNACSSLRTATIPNSVTKIDSFKDCRCLAHITIPRSVTTMTSSGFENCYGLTNVSIRGGISSLPSRAFYQCYGVGYYDFSRYTEVPTLSSTNAFDVGNYGYMMGRVFYVPMALLDEWKAATNWSSFASQIIGV